MSYGYAVFALISKTQLVENTVPLHTVGKGFHFCIVINLPPKKGQ